MKISLNYLQKCLDFKIKSSTELADLIGMQLGALEEEPIHLAKAYQNILVVKVIKAEPLNGSDHLKLCKISDGKIRTDLNSLRDKEGFLQVLCGAPNVMPGLTTAWIPPGAIVPSTYGNENFEIQSRSMLGEISHGMLASLKELAISEDHSGIIELDDYFLEGSTLIEALELDDVILDIENKMFTHRPDCFGLLGIAREIAGIYRQRFVSPDWYLSDNFKNNLRSKPKYNLSLNNHVPDLVKRFSAVVLEDIEIAKSPVLVQSYLSRMNINPINNVVDATNLTMLETAQPMHAYDLDKLSSSPEKELVLAVRLANEHEQIKLLNDKTYKLTKTDLVIDFNSQAVGLAGVMGGQSSQIDSSTKRVLLEAASFDMYAIRRTSMRHGIFSEAVTRFTKGQSPLATKRTLLRCLDLVDNYNSNNVLIVSKIADDNRLSPKQIKQNNIFSPVSVKLDYINSLLGTELTSKYVASLLSNTEFKIKSKNKDFVIEAPFWRTDIESQEDIVEEVGRLHGYQHIIPKNLLRPAQVADKESGLVLKSEIRRILSSFGANETLNYSFVSPKLLNNINIDLKQAFQIANPISPDLSYFRTSLLPSLIVNVHPNLKQGYKQFCLYEMGTFHLTKYIDSNGVNEFKSLALVYASQKKESIPAYYVARHYLETLLFELFKSDFSFKPVNDPEVVIDDYLQQMLKPFNLDRTAVVYYQDKFILGFVGEFDPKIIASYKLPNSASGFEIDLGRLKSIKPVNPYQVVSRFPVVNQDITLELNGTVLYDKLHSILMEELASLAKAHQASINIKLLNIYNKELKDRVRYTFRVTFTNYERTLTDTEVNQLLLKLDDILSKKLKVKRI